jgi:hypothetical protein
MSQLMTQEQNDFNYLFKKGVELRQNINGSFFNCIVYIENNHLCIAKNKNSHTVTRISLKKLIVYPYEENIIGFTTIDSLDKPTETYHIYTTKTYIRDYIVRLFNQVTC